MNHRQRPVLRHKRQQVLQVIGVVRVHLGGHPRLMEPEIRQPQQGVVTGDPLLKQRPHIRRPRRPRVHLHQPTRRPCRPTGPGPRALPRPLCPLPSPPQPSSSQFTMPTHPRPGRYTTRASTRPAPASPDNQNRSPSRPAAAVSRGTGGRVFGQQPRHLLDERACAAVDVAAEEPAPPSTTPRPAALRRAGPPADAGTGCAPVSTPVRLPAPRPAWPWMRGDHHRAPSTQWMLSITTGDRCGCRTGQQQSPATTREHHAKPAGIAQSAPEPLTATNDTPRCLAAAQRVVRPMPGQNRLPRSSPGVAAGPEERSSCCGLE